MTELKTAEEWDMDWTLISSSSPWKRQFVRDIQRNALEAAAKAVCWNCHEGVPIFKDGGYRNHGKDEFSAFGNCDAANIIKMIEELQDPASAGSA